ncbi:ABC transporter permease [Chelativorans alearense]|uniref:ABC transporter permease n=1 Tax=Chelativorans alearense TaxID=2681495 RepID=UPI0013D8B35E|nr:ABC transporter permease [Chelativorans alearense]
MAVLRDRFLTNAWRWFVYGAMAFFVVNVFLIIASVVVSSLGTSWFTGWLPEGYTAKWYGAAWKEFQLYYVLIATVQITLAVVAISLMLGVPAAYVLARIDFRGKRLVLLTFLVPLLVPPITYGIPMATVLYQAGLGGTIWGVILANLVPSVPFVVLVMTPFIEQIDPRLESAARVFGASAFTTFLRILVPLLTPGILAAGILVLIRTISMFELTFLTAGPDSQTLIVALYYSVFAAGVRAQQSIDAMAVMYMVTTMTGLLIALRFVDPSQLVGRVDSKKASAT